MAITTYLKLVIDGAVHSLPGGKAGEGEARRIARAAIGTGAQYIDLYRAAIGTTDWKLLRHFEPVKASTYFRATAKLLTYSPSTEPILLPFQSHAESLLDSIFATPRGTQFVRDISSELQPSQTRSSPVRNVFTLAVRASKNGQLQYYVLPHPGHVAELVEMLLTAATTKPTKVASTPHFMRVGRRRQRSITR